MLALRSAGRRSDRVRLRQVCRCWTPGRHSRRRRPAWGWLRSANRRTRRTSSRRTDQCRGRRQRYSPWVARRRPRSWRLVRSTLAVIVDLEPGDGKQQPGQVAAGAGPLRHTVAAELRLPRGVRDVLLVRGGSQLPGQRVRIGRGNTTLSPLALESSTWYYFSASVNSQARRTNQVKWLNGTAAWPTQKGRDGTDGTYEPPLRPNVRRGSPTCVSAEPARLLVFSW